MKGKSHSSALAVPRFKVVEGLPCPDPWYCAAVLDPAHRLKANANQQGKQSLRQEGLSA